MKRTAILATKACLIWLLLVAFAVANGALREQWLQPLFGYRIALPLSGISLSLLVFLVAWLCIPWLGRQSARVFVLTGILWVGLTLGFEFIFGHFVRAQSWQELLRVFDLPGGNLFILVLLSALLAPLLVAHWRKMITRRGPDS